MRTINLLYLFVLILTLLSCGNGKDLNKKFKLVTNAKNQTIAQGQKLNISLQPDKGVVLDSVVYKLDGQRLGSKKDASNLETDMHVIKLGKKRLTATLYAEGKEDSITSQITMLAAKAPQLYGYEIVNTYPHDVSSYTQGLEFHNGKLYESTGEYGESALLEVDYKTGKINKKIKLDDKYFGEGLTIINNLILQLTWKEGEGFIYDLNSFAKKGTFTYGQSKQGWGLCNDGQTVYKSDGTTKIWLLDPEKLTEESYIEIADNRAVHSKYNELEWVDGKIYGNTYQKDGISIIDPITGAIEAVIDMRPLKKKVQSGLDPNNEVLNGIALNPETHTLFVTGKHWNKLFEIKVIKNP